MESGLAVVGDGVGSVAGRGGVGRLGDMEEGGRVAERGELGEAIRPRFF